MACKLYLQGRSAQHAACQIIWPLQRWIDGQAFIVPVMPIGELVRSAVVCVESETAAPAQGSSVGQPIGGQDVD